jgi:hypothetical protein
LDEVRLQRKLHKFDVTVVLILVKQKQTQE